MRIIVTGGNSGVGKATAAVLADAGHGVVIACRSIEKAERAAVDMSGDVEVAPLDLADLASVRAFANSVETVDVLVNNAGVMGLPLTRTRRYSAMTAYAESKLANLLFVRALTARHPGVRV
jgi:NAD(P)-dependent dehydrogenase (short-subunit alcohol dehydrogenase family)